MFHYLGLTKSSSFFIRFFFKQCLSSWAILVAQIILLNQAFGRSQFLTLSCSFFSLHFCMVPFPILFQIQLAINCHFIARDEILHSSRREDRFRILAKCKFRFSIENERNYLGFFSGGSCWTFFFKCIFILNSDTWFVAQRKNTH